MNRHGNRSRRLLHALAGAVAWCATAGALHAQASGPSAEGRDPANGALAQTAPLTPDTDPFCTGLRDLVRADPLDLRGGFVGETSLGSRSYEAEIGISAVGAVRLYVRPAVVEHYTLEAMLEQPGSEAEGLMRHHQWKERVGQCLAKTHRTGTDENHTLSLERTPYWPLRADLGAVVNLSLERDWADRHWVKLIVAYPAD